MNCDAAREILDGAFDGRDEGLRLAEAEAHADFCKECAAYRLELRAYASLMDDLPQIDVPEGLEARLLVAVERNRPKSRSPLLPVTFLTFLAFGAFIGTQFVSDHAQDRAREVQQAQEHRDTIARSVARDRAMFAADPIGGSPVIAFTGHASK